MRCVWGHDGAKNGLLNCIEWMYVCMHASKSVIFAARMVLMHINVNILFAVQSRPHIQVSFHGHYVAYYFDIT